VGDNGAFLLSGRPSSIIVTVLLVLLPSLEAPDLSQPIVKVTGTHIHAAYGK
jgi:hypothetical protein